MSDPNNFEYWFKRAMKCISKHAIIGNIFEDLKKALELNPYHIESWIYYAGSAIGDNNKIVEAVQKLLKYKPRAEISQNLFDYLLKKVQNYAENDAPLKIPYEESTMNYNLQYGGEWLITATYYWKRREFQKAYDAFKKAFSISIPSNRDLAIYWYINLVVSLLDKEYDKAIEYGEKAVELDPRFKYAWQQLSKAYFFKENYSNALNSIEKALKIDNNFNLAVKFKEEIDAKIIKIEEPEKDERNYYQRQKLTKEEIDFLIALEKECGKPIPAISKVKWDDPLLKFGFVARDGHIIELGITYEAENLKIIPESIKNLKCLEVLSIVNSGLLRFPESVIYLKNLKYLSYDHSKYHTKGLESDLYPEVICNLISLEELKIEGMAITALPECLIFFPHLRKIDISGCYKLAEIPPIFYNYFKYVEFRRPKRCYLIRIITPPIWERDQISPNIIYEKYSQKRIDENQAVESLLSIIEKEKLLEKRIECIKMLNELSFQNDTAFKVLEKLISSDKSILIRMAAAETILKNFPNKAILPIKTLLLNEKSVKVLNFVQNLISSIESPVIQSIKIELLDSITLIDVEKIIGQRLPEIDNFEIIKKKYHRRQGPHGYIKRNNRIVRLGISTYSHYVNHELYALPESISNLDQLEELKLIDCRNLTNLPERIGKLKNLKILDFRGCRQLKAIPESLCKLQNLEYLNLSECYSLKNLPSNLGNLKNLKILILKDCQSLTNLSKSLSNLTLLTELDLENCRSLKLLPKSITNLKNLEELNLNRCRRLEALPENIGNIKSLKILKLRSCTRLRKLPGDIFNLQTPEILDLSYCYRLTKLPESIETWENLTKVSCKGCRELKSIPESIGKLPNLEELDLNACRKLESLPESIGTLKNLKNLELSYCELLEALPDSIVNLKNLEEMNLDGCTSLTLIPENIGLMNNLSVYKKNYNRAYAYFFESEDKYQLKPPPPHLNHQDWPLNIKKHQEKINSEFKFPQDLLNEKIQRLVKNGVIIEDAKNLAKFFIILDGDLAQTPLYKDLDEDRDDMHIMFDYKIDVGGHVVELHMHHTEYIFIAVFPKELCFLNELEVVRFPQNIIEEIIECITNLKSLRVLDVSNFEAPAPTIPNSIKSFIESLESYNEFY